MSILFSRANFSQHRGRQLHTPHTGEFGCSRALDYVVWQASVELFNKVEPAAAARSNLTPRLTRSVAHPAGRASRRGEHGTGTRPTRQAGARRAAPPGSHRDEIHALASYLLEVE